MSATPTPGSPLATWPAPTLTDAAHRNLDNTTVSGSRRSVRRQPVAGALQAARRLLDPGLRAEHAALRDEQRIADELRDLPCGWFVTPLADVVALDVQPSPTDHFVVGPGGVFIIRSEHRPAAQIWVSEQSMTIDGVAGNRLTEARIEARYAGLRLSDRCGFDVTVQSALVMIGAIVHTVSRPAEVHVRDQHDLRDWLCMQPVRLDGETVGAIHQRAGRSRSEAVL
jgi:hypothetical protein